MLTIKDIVDLAKAGYKPADVKELIEISKSNDDRSSDVPPADSDTDKEDNAENNPQIDPNAGGTEDPNEPDYKSLYETTKKELEKVQKENAKKDISSEDDYISDSDIIKDLIKDFM